VTAIKRLLRKEECGFLRKAQGEEGVGVKDSAKSGEKKRKAVVQEAQGKHI